MLFSNLTKSNRLSRNTFFAALFLIAAIAMYRWIVAPHTTYLFAAQQYESIVDNTVKKNKVISNTLKVKKKKLEELHQQFDQLQSTLFTLDEVKKFFSDLEAISEETDCAVYSLNFVTGQSGSKRKQSENTSGIVSNRAMLSVVGLYGSIIRLVERLRAGNKKVWIDSVRMENLRDDSPLLKCDMTITIYAIKDQEASYE